MKLPRPTPVLAVAGRELRAVFRTSTGWWIAAGVHLLAGAFFLVLLDGYVQIAAEASAVPFLGGGPDLETQLLGPWFGVLTILLLVVTPALSMRAYAEEVRQHTLELLLTSPVTATEIVLGKFLGTWTVLAAVFGTTAWWPLSLGLWSAPDPGAVLGGFLALSALGAALTALGHLASAFTDRPVVALVLGFSVTLAMWVVGRVDPDPQSVFAQLSLAQHVQDLALGALRLSDVSYFVLLTGWALFATQQRLVSWRYA